MVSAVAALILAFVVTTVCTPMVRSLAIRAGVVDEPGGRRVHKQVTPRLGGLAVIAGFFLPLIIFAQLRTGAMVGFLEQQDLVIGLVYGSAIVGAVGAVDDARSLGPWAKLLAQAVAAVVAYRFGYRIDAVNIPLIGTLSMGAFALPVTVFWFLAITNAINLIDGLDGLAVGIAFFATVSNFAIAYLNGSHIVLLLSGALAGSLLGFLRYNFNPATIFLGDSGSMFLGFALAATSLVGSATKSSTAVALLAPIIALGVPIVDTTLAMVRRTLAHKSIFAADRGHIHHRLLDLGLTHRRVVLTLYGFSIALAVAAVAIAFGRSIHIGLALTILVLVAFTVVRMVRSGRAKTVQLDKTLVSSIRAAIGLLSQVRDEAQVRDALAQLTASRVDVDAQLAVGQFDHQSLADDNALVLDVSVGDRERFLRVSVQPTLNLRDPELANLVSDLASACRSALEQLFGRESQSARFQVVANTGSSKK